MFFFKPRVSSLFHIKNPLELRWTSAWGLRRRGKEELRGAEAEGEGAHRGVTTHLGWPMAYRAYRAYRAYGQAMMAMAMFQRGFLELKHCGPKSGIQQKMDQILMWVWCSQIQWNRPYINDTGYLFVISTGLQVLIISPWFRGFWMLLILISTSIHDFILFIATAGCIETSSFSFFSLDRWCGRKFKPRCSEGVG